MYSLPAGLRSRLPSSRRPRTRRRRQNRNQSRDQRQQSWNFVIQILTNAVKYLTQQRAIREESRHSSGTPSVSSSEGTGAHRRCIGTASAAASEASGAIDPHRLQSALPVDLTKAWNAFPLHSARVRKIQLSCPLICPPIAPLQSTITAPTKRECLSRPDLLPHSTYRCRCAFRLIPSLGLIADLGAVDGNQAR